MKEFQLIVWNHYVEEQTELVLRSFVITFEGQLHAHTVLSLLCSFYSELQRSMGSVGKHQVKHQLEVAFSQSIHSVQC